MAYQKGNIKLEGQLGDLTFYKQNGTYRARAKKGVDAKRIATDPKFERTRENSSEFGRASAIAKKIRLALHAVLPLFHEATMQTRLNGRVLQVIKNDAANVRGKRTLSANDLPLLIGFSFNAASAWKDVYFGNVIRSLDTASRNVRVAFPSYWGPAVLAGPKEASGVRFSVAAITMDLESGRYESRVEHSPILSRSSTLPEQLFELEMDTADEPVLLLAGLAFFREKAGYVVPIEEPMLNALDIIDVL